MDGNRSLPGQPLLEHELNDGFSFKSQSLRNYAVPAAYRLFPSLCQLESQLPPMVLKHVAEQLETRALKTYVNPRYTKDQLVQAAKAIPV